MPALRRDRRLRLPPLEGRSAFPLPGLQEGFLNDQRNAVRQPQAAAARYLAAIAIFCNEVKGKSALALSRDLCVSYKCAFVLLHKLREAMAAELKGRMIGGEGKIAEVDGGYFGGYIKPANLRENRRDRRLARNQTGKRKVVVVVRERGGNSVPAVFKSEAKAMAFLRAHVAKGTILNADEAGSWEELHKRYEVRRINHEEAYSLDGACTNWAEEFFCRMRRAEIGHHHHIAGTYLLRYAQEASWREDNRRESNGAQVNRIAGLAMAQKPSVDFSGYWQRHAHHRRTGAVRVGFGGGRSKLA